MSNNEDKKKKKEDDPYDFFKLEGTKKDNKSKNNNNKNNNDNFNGFPIWAVIVIAAVFLVIFNMIAVPQTDEVLGFSEFRQYVESGQIVSVEFGENYVLGFGPEII